MHQLQEKQTPVVLKQQHAAYGSSVAKTAFDCCRLQYAGAGKIDFILAIILFLCGGDQLTPVTIVSKFIFWGYIIRLPITNYNLYQ